jgi:hypothetical protein
VFRLILVVTLGGLFALGAHACHETSGQGDQKQRAKKSKPSLGKKKTAEKSAKGSAPSRPLNAPSGSTPSGASTGSLPDKSTPRDPLFSAFPKGSNTDSIVGLIGIASVNILAREVAALSEGKAQQQSHPLWKRKLKSRFKNALKFRHVDWLVENAPIRILIADPAKYRGGRVIVLPMTGRSAAMSGLPDTAKRDVQGHAAHIDIGSARYFVDFVTGHMVLTGHDSLFKHLKVHLATDLLLWKPPQPVIIKLHMARLLALHGANFGQRHGVVHDRLNELFRGHAWPGADALLKAQLEGIFSLLKSTDLSVVGLKTQNGNLVVSVGIKARSDTGLNHFIAGMKGRKSSIAKSVVASAWLALASHLDDRKSTALKQFNNASADVYAVLFKLDAKEKTQLRSIMDKAWDNGTGHQAFFVYQDESFPLAFAQVKEVKNATEAQRLDKAFFSLLFQKASQWLNQKMNNTLPLNAGLKTKKKVTLLDTINTVSEAQGIRISLHDEKTKQVSLVGIDVSFDWEKLGKTIGNPGLESLVGKRLRLALAYGVGRTAFVMGPGAFKMAQKLASGPVNPGLKSFIIDGRKHAVASFLDWGKLGQVLKVFSKSLGAQFPSVTQGTRPHVLSLTGKSDGSEAVFRVSVPSSLLKTLQSRPE